MIIGLPFVCLSFGTNQEYKKKGRIRKPEKKRRRVTKKRKKYMEKQRLLTLALSPLLNRAENTFCSTLGAGAPVSGPPNGGDDHAMVATAEKIVPMLTLPPSEATPPLLAPSLGESNIASPGEVPVLLPGVLPVS